MSRNVVIYSGGVDSTVVLYLLGLFSTKKNPVIALSVKEHYRCNKEQFKKQTIARHKYIKWAKQQRHFIKLHEISVDGDIVGNVDLHQHHCWASLLHICWKPGDIISWGYKNEEVNNNFKNYLNDLNKFTNEYNDYAPIQHTFPLKYLSWKNTIAIIKQAEIPEECIWVCDHMHNGKACGYCGKCQIMGDIYPGLVKKVED